MDPPTYVLNLKDLVVNWTHENDGDMIFPKRREAPSDAVSHCITAES